MKLPILILFSMLALLAGLWAALLRLGWSIPGGQGILPVEHGPLMVSGFLGSLITLERVAALKKKWMIMAPLLVGLGWVFSLLPQAFGLGRWLIALGSLGAAMIMAVIYRREPALHTAALEAGALSWLAGNLLWLAGLPIYRVVFWWMGFLVLTISGERLELSRVLKITRRAQILFGLAAGIFLIGAFAGLWLPEIGARLAGAGLLGLSLWMIRYDLARRNLRHPAALTRYMAFCLFTGYIWLGIGGVINITFGAAFPGPQYDAALHTVFVGFVISMIFGHAPIILPALLNIMMPFHGANYLNLVLLQASLLLRILGDLSGWPGLWKWGGLFNVVAILLFLALTFIAVRQAYTRTAI